jgi:hypothetical protein
MQRSWNSDCWHRGVAWTMRLQMTILGAAAGRERRRRADSGAGGRGAESSI